MIKKVALILIILLTTITPILQEGDSLEFNDTKTGETITGTVTDYEPNGFLGQDATLLIENFKIKSTGEKLDGLIYCKGNEHNQIMEFVAGFSATPFVRGGEVKILPTEQFTLERNGKYKEEKIPIKLKPVQVITSDHDEIEVGTNIRFKTVNDVYKNDKKYINANTPVVGSVSHFKENGWMSDAAEMELNDFKTRDVNNKLIKIDTTLTINAFEMLKWQNPKSRRVWNYFTSGFRGKEFNIIPS